jgi:hypothetical protein
MALGSCPRKGFIRIVFQKFPHNLEMAMDARFDERYVALFIWNFQIYYLAMIQQFDNNRSMTKTEYLVVFQ